MTNIDSRHLCRGKRLDNGEWETGFLVVTRFMCHDEKNFIADKMTGYHTPVAPATVGRCTGMEDKTGRLIYEGDIVRSDDVVHDGEVQMAGSSHEVEMQKGCWVIRNMKDWDFLYTNARACKKIGDIHDTPELLEMQP